MSELKLQAKTRQATGKAVADLRDQGLMPAVLYGYDVKEAQNLSVSQNDFDRLFKIAGSTTLLNLSIDDKDLGQVLIQDVQYDPVKHVVIHADLYKVDMTKKITATVPLVLVGVSSAVTELGGVLVHNLDEVEVRCLPTALVKEITVDVSGLKGFDQVIHVADLVVPEGIEIVTAPDIAVALVSEPRAEEVVVPVEAPVATDDKKEGEKTDDNKATDEKKSE